jgi:hypothetical protein
MDAKKRLFRYLYLALLEMRYTAYERGDKKSFAISHMLHNLPLKIAKDNVDYEALLAELQEFAQSDAGLTAWLENNKGEE